MDEGTMIPENLPEAKYLVCIGKHGEQRNAARAVVVELARKGIFREPEAVRCRINAMGHGDNQEFEENLGLLVMVENVKGSYALTTWLATRNEAAKAAVVEALEKDGTLARMFPALAPKKEEA